MLTWQAVTNQEPAFLAVELAALGRVLLWPVRLIQEIQEARQARKLEAIARRIDSSYWRVQ